MGLMVDVSVKSWLCLWVFMCIFCLVSWNPVNDHVDTHTISLELLASWLVLELVIMVTVLVTRWDAMWICARYADPTLVPRDVLSRYGGPVRFWKAKFGPRFADAPVDCDADDVADASGVQLAEPPAVPALAEGAMSPGGTTRARAKSSISDFAAGRGEGLPAWTRLVVPHKMTAVQRLVKGAHANQQQSLFFAGAAGDDLLLYVLQIVFLLQAAYLGISGVIFIPDVAKDYGNAKAIVYAVVSAVPVAVVFAYAPSMLQSVVQVRATALLLPRCPPAPARRLAPPLTHSLPLRPPRSGALSTCGSWRRPSASSRRSRPRRR